MGDPLILLDHVEDAGAEATLLGQPGWRCVFFDPIASLFVVDRTNAFPALDFAARHFCDPAWQKIPPAPLGLAEAAALIKLGSALGRRPATGSRWSLRFSLMLLASDRLRQALAAGSESDLQTGATAGLWNLIGHCSWNMIPDLRVPPAGPDEPWDPARGLLMAQATSSYRRSLEINPSAASALASLHDSFKARRMLDAQRSALVHLRRFQLTHPGSSDDIRSANLDDGSTPILASQSEPDLALAVNSLIDKGQPETAVRLFDDSVRRGIAPSWTVCDRVAATLLHLGRPAEAIELWECAAPPARAQQLVRIATAALAMFDFETALRINRSALDIDPNLTEAWFVAALLHTQRGDAAAASAAAREGIKRSPTPSQKAFFTAIQAFVAPYADVPNASPP